MGWYVEATKPCSDSAPRLEFLKTRGSRNHHDLKFQGKAASRTIEPGFAPLKLSSPLRAKQCQALNQSGQDKNTADDSQRFVAREASEDNEYYRAALLRAETHFEEQPHLRHVDSFKLQFAELEFTAIKRRSKAQFRQKSVCIIMDCKEEKDVKQKAHKCLVGTVDVYIRKLLPGEAIPQESIDVHIRPFVHKTEDSTTLYGYVANLCVAKSARRQGVAKTMLSLSIEHAKANGADHVYVHVERSNEPARKLYKQMGFQVVEEKDRTCLLCLKT